MSDPTDSLSIGLHSEFGGDIQLGDYGEVSGGTSNLPSLGRVGIAAAWRAKGRCDRNSIG